MRVKVVVMLTSGAKQNPPMMAHKRLFCRGEWASTAGPGVYRKRKSALTFRAESGRLRAVLGGTHLVGFFSACSISFTRW